MQTVRRILVGVDLSRCHPLVSSSLGANVNTCVETGIALAQACGAELLILTVFNWTEDSMHHLDPQDRSTVKHTFEQEANLVLGDLIARARGRGVQAKGKLVLGKPWREIVREVVLGRHDLLVIGPHEPFGFYRFAGNTAVTLLRTCPCPVWVAKPECPILRPRMLVATDLGPASENALHWGLVLGSALDAAVHVLHVTVCRIDELGWSAEPDPDVQVHHQEVLSAAQKSVHELVDAALNALGESSGALRNSLEVHVAEDVGNPAHVIEKFIEAQRIDLLVVGTAARRGLAGLIVGNTSERWLPGVHCSLLTVKAADFQCPLTFPAEES